MSKVILEEGGTVNVHTRIKDMCRAARNRMGLTNQDISNMISEKFGIEDFSVNTINNFFSERSKATTIYTTGYICAVLDISIDAVFGIENNFTSEKETEFIRQLSELKVELRIKEQQTEHLNEKLSEKDERLQQAHKAIDHYRSQLSEKSKSVPAWAFIVALVALVSILIFTVSYIVMFDIGNPEYGLFSRLNNIQTEQQLPDQETGENL